MRGMSAALARVLLGLLMSVAACSSSGLSAHDAGLDAAALPDARTQDALVDASDASASAPPCPLGDQECLYTTPPWAVRLRAAEIGADVKFRALGGYAILLEASGAFELWRVLPEQEEPERWRFPAGDWRAIDVFADDPWRDDDGSASVWALACNEQLARCALFRGYRGGDTLSEQSPPLPGLSYRGLTTAAVDKRGTTCAFGAGLVCLVDGAWQTWLEPVHLLRDVHGTYPLLFAFAENGDTWLARYEKDGSRGPLVMQPTRLAGDLTGVSVADGELALTTSQRLSRFASDGGVFECEAPGLQTLLLATGTSGTEDALFADGRLLSRASYGQKRSWCHGQSIDFDGPLVDTDRVGCGFGGLSSILTVSTLWQNSGCFYTVP